MNEAQEDTDKTVEALELDFEVKTEQWSEYQLLE